MTTEREEFEKIVERACDKDKIHWDKIYSWHQQSVERAVRKAQDKLLDWFNLSVIGYPDEKQRFMVKVKKIEINSLIPPQLDVKDKI